MKYRDRPKPVMTNIVNLNREREWRQGQKTAVSWEEPACKSQADYLRQASIKARTGVHFKG